MRNYDVGPDPEAVPEAVLAETEHRLCGTVARNIALAVALALLAVMLACLFT